MPESYLSGLLKANGIMSAELCRTNLARSHHRPALRLHPEAVLKPQRLPAVNESRDLAGRHQVMLRGLPFITLTHRLALPLLFK